MDRLPQEIIDAIVEAFPQDLELPLRQTASSKRRKLESSPRRLSEFSTVSKGWRRAVERRLFNTIDSIGSGAFQLSFFKTILEGESNENRRDSVRSFTYTTYLAFQGQQSMTDFVRDGQLRLFYEFREFFTVINDIWSTDLGEIKRRPLALTVSIVGIGHWDPECDENAFTFPQAATRLPLAPAVTSLKIVFDQALDKGRSPRRFRQSGRGNQVPPAWILQPLMAKLPSVDKLSYEMFDFLGKEQFRDRLFTETFHTLTGPLATNLTELYLHVGPFGFRTFNQLPSKYLASMATTHVSNKSGEDDHSPRFNSAVRQLSQQLSVLHVTGLFAVHPDLFYPKELTNGRVGVSLKKARLREQSLGRGLTIDRFLSRDPKELNDLAVSVSRGMLCMPKLESVEIAFRVESQDLIRGEIGGHGYSQRITYQRKWLAETVLDTSAEGGTSATCYLLNDIDLRKNHAFKSVISDEVEENLVELSRRLRGLSLFPSW
ncbi:hypothetical protein B0H65DRAFT_534524 [Neurospora tetraspora]|uniref:Uncharacterized protein n=1 Tax=Neurospora tetraspora TaxID=94610 RepID=A0AAE0J0Q5_9PEZI|nr:hypothetical protein B0H65DRAFT_534524 [Neurospora tetraspora]